MMGATFKSVSTFGNWVLINVMAVLCLSCLGAFASCQESRVSNQHRILIFSKTAEFRHESIEAGVIRLRKIGADLNLKVDHTEDSNFFQDSILNQYDLVIFLSTTGDVLNDRQEKAFESFINDGGHFMGIHAATDTEYDWPWYFQLVGAYFDHHPALQAATMNVTDTNHLACQHLGKQWSRIGEWYNYKAISPDIHIILNVDESTYSGGIHGENHPISWHQTFGESRSFYTAIGHTAESFSEPKFVEHLKGGIVWCLGVN